MTSQRHRIFVVAAVVAVVDQFTKLVAVAMWSDGAASFAAIDLTVVRNSGGPFGVAAGATLLWTAATAVILIIAVAAIANGRLEIYRLGTWSTVAVGAIVGGGVGNLMDRIVRSPGFARGAVVDWIAIDPYPRVFNLADVALRAGAAVMVGAVIVGSLADRRRFRQTNGARR